METIEMNVSFEINTVAKRIQITFYGRIESGEINKFMLELIRNEDFEPDMDLLVDMSEALIDSEFEAVVRFNNTLKAIQCFWGQSNWAVVPGNQTNYRTIQRQIFLSENASIHLKIFNNLDAAEAWLFRTRAHKFG